jgi:crotonobetainyl-CoA:carnitine CoA-transferase CaiB-like acyl-CoA transferase
MSGIMIMTGEADRKPARIGGSLIDMGAATNAVLGVAMALLQRATTGQGQKVESSLLETAVGWGGEWGAYYTLNGEVPQRMGSKKASYAPVGAYETRDGLVYVAAFGDTTFERLCEALDLDELANDEQFADAEDRRRHREALDERLEAATRGFDREVLVDRLLDHGVPAARIYEIPEVIADPHLDHRNMFLEMESEDGTDMVVPATPITLSGSDRADSTDLPDVGADSAAVARSLGYDDGDVEALLDAGVLRSS